MCDVLLGFGLVGSSAEALGHRPAIEVAGPARLRLCWFDRGGHRAPRSSFNVEGSFGFGRAGRLRRRLDTAPENVILVVVPVPRFASASARVSPVATRGGPRRVGPGWPVDFGSRVGRASHSGCVGCARRVRRRLLRGHLGFAATWFVCFEVTCWSAGSRVRSRRVGLGSSSGGRAEQALGLSPRGRAPGPMPMRVDFGSVVEVSGRTFTFRVCKRRWLGRWRHRLGSARHYRSLRRRRACGSAKGLVPEPVCELSLSTLCSRAMATSHECVGRSNVDPICGSGPEGSSDFGPGRLPPELGFAPARSTAPGGSSAVRELR